MNRLPAPFFRWKDINSTDMGVYMISRPTRSVAVLNGQKANNLGRDGFTFYDEGGYGAVTIKCDIAIPKALDLDAALAWLSGSGHLVFSDESSFYWDAMVITSYNRTSPFKRLEGQKMTITWTCQPFRYLNSESLITRTSTGSFNGQGHVASCPLIRVVGSSTAANPATLMINGDSMQLILSSNTPLYIDCDAKAAYVLSSGVRIYAGQNVMIAAGSDWYRLNPAGQSNTVNTMTNISEIRIQPRWRYF
jgi:phage-related protein